MHGEPGLVRSEGKEIGSGSGERELEGLWVEGAHADIGEGFQFTRRVRFGAFEGREHVGVFGSEFGREDAFH